jgi:acetyl esterase/lipase
MSKLQRDAVDQLMRNGPLDLGGDVRQQRVIFDEMLTSHPLPDDVRTTPGSLGGVPAVHVEVAGTPPTGAVILYFHGGAYALGAAASTAGLAADLGRKAHARVISVDYRLAPEHPHPAAVNDAVAAYRALLDSGVPTDRIAVAGESAGAGLALATLVAAKAAALPQPRCALLLSPWVDLTLSGDSITGKATADPAVTAAALRRRAADYAGTADPADTLISPLFADLSGLPPLLIQAGSHEILLDDATRLAARAAAADIDITLDITAEVPHAFQAFAAILDEADAALTRAGSFIRRHLDDGHDNAA